MEPTEDEVKHGIGHTFVHEDPFTGKPSDFWSENKDGLPCLYDHHPFVGPIYSYPIARDSLKGTWAVRGIFCSPYCVKAYINSQSNIPPRCNTLFTLMMTMVYHASTTIPPASDIEELLYTKKTIEEWRALPKQYIQVRWVVPQEVPFHMENRKVFSYPTSGHPALSFIKTWNSSMAEKGDAPDDDVAFADVQPQPPVESQLQDMNDAE